MVLASETLPRGTKDRILSFLNSRREEIIERQYNEIKELESKYKSLYEGAPVMLRTVDRDGIILDCNEAYATGLGYLSRQEVIGQSIFDHTPEDFVAAKRQSFEEWRRTGKVTNKQVWLKRKDGSKFPGLISANNLYDARGNFVGSNTVITDLTEIIESRRLQEKAVEEIRIAQQMRQEFLNIAAHELRTPVQPILGYTELYKRGRVEADAAIDGIRESAIRLRDLANDILAVTRIESGNLSYEMQHIHFEIIMSELVNHGRITIESLGKADAVKLAIQADSVTTSQELHVDRGRILQALENVLQNAIKFTERGTIKIEACVLPKGLFEITVSDPGPGILPDMIPRLFEKFASKTHSDYVLQKGTGLGLFIAKSIIQAHGGDIFGYNNEGAPGATFVIRLPIGDGGQTVKAGLAT